MMHDPNKILQELLALPDETEWVEFKHNNTNPEEIGEYLSALSNGAALHAKTTAYLVWGVEAGSHRCVGTTFQPKREKKGNEPLENWWHRLLKPQIDFTIHEIDFNGLAIVLWEIQAANSAPVRFSGEEFIRVGQQKKKLKDFPEKERKLWQLLSGAQHDWSALTVESASLADLDPISIAFARTQFLEKYPHLSGDVSTWDDATFLSKAKVCTAGKVTNAALLLLGKAESSHFLAPAVAQLSWALHDDKRQVQDYEHFGLPLILSSNQILAKIRNLTVRHLPSGTLFPTEVAQYDLWVMRETLHNCIAHQDYAMRARINVIESPGALLFTNAGAFIPGTVEHMIHSDAPPAVYRNKFLADAMVNLNMIDTIGSGIKKMFTLQRQRNFPMPDYDLSKPDEVRVVLTGQILDEKYTRALMMHAELDLMDVIALDKVQKKRAINNEEFKRLKMQALIEGRRPNLFVSAKVALATGDKATYIKNRGLDKAHYKALVVSYLNQFGKSKKADLAAFLLEKLSDALSPEQKANKVRNLLQEMRRDGTVHGEGKGRGALWTLAKSGTEPGI